MEDEEAIELDDDELEDEDDESLLEPQVNYLLGIKNGNVVKIVLE